MHCFFVSLSCVVLGSWPDATDWCGFNHSLSLFRLKLLSLSSHKYTSCDSQVTGNKCLLSTCVSLCFPRHLIWYVIEKWGSALLVGKQKEHEIAFMSTVQLPQVKQEDLRWVMFPWKHLSRRSYRTISGSTCSRCGCKYHLHGGLLLSSEEIMKPLLSAAFSNYTLKEVPEDCSVSMQQGWRFQQLSKGFKRWSWHVCARSLSSSETSRGSSLVSLKSQQGLSKSATAPVFIGSKPTEWFGPLQVSKALSNPFALFTMSPLLSGDLREWMGR